MAAMAESEPSSVRALYSIMTSIESRLGGGEGVEGMYGSISKAGMHKILSCMKDTCGLGSDSQMVDVGAGLGRPLLHALLYPGIRAAYGIELDRIKCDKAAAFVEQTFSELRRRGEVGGEGQPPVSVPPVLCTAVEKVVSLDPATHAYSFWEGVPREGKAAFGRLFARSRTLQSVAVVQRAVRSVPPADMMLELGFGPLRLAACFPVAMSGSGQSFRAYIFTRCGPRPSAAAPLPPLASGAVAAAPTRGQHGDQQDDISDASCSTGVPRQVGAALGQTQVDGDGVGGSESVVVGSVTVSGGLARAPSVVELCSEHSLETLTGVSRTTGLTAGQQQQQAGSGRQQAASGGPQQLRPRRSMRITELLVQSRPASSSFAAKAQASAVKVAATTDMATSTDGRPPSPAAAAVALQVKGSPVQGVAKKRSPSKARAAVAAANVAAAAAAVAVAAGHDAPAGKTGTVIAAVGARQRRPRTVAKALDLGGGDKVADGSVGSAQAGAGAGIATAGKAGRQLRRKHQEVRIGLGANPSTLGA